MSDWRDRETPRLANLKRDLAECIARVKNLEAEYDAIQALNKSLLAHNGALLRDLGQSQSAIRAKTIEECRSIAYQYVDTPIGRTIVEQFRALAKPSAETGEGTEQ